MKRPSPPPCEQCNLPMGLNGYRQGNGGFTAYYFRCIRCAINKTIRVEGGRVQKRRHHIPRLSAPASNKIIYAKAYTGFSLDVFYTDSEIEALREIRGPDPDVDAGTGAVIRKMGTL